MAKNKKRSLAMKRSWETRRKNIEKTENQNGPELEINAEQEPKIGSKIDYRLKSEPSTLTQAIANVEIALAKLKELL